MNNFLEYVPGTSFMHKLNPVTKFLGAICFAVACFLTSNIWVLLGFLVMALALSASCGMLKKTTGLMKAVLVFSLLLAIIQILATPKGDVLVELPWGYIGTGSLMAALTTIARLEAAAIPLFLIFYVTKVSDLTNAFVKILHVPYKYAFTFSSTVHFIPVFLNDMSGIMEAQTARGIEFDNVGFFKKIALIAPLCVPLLVSSVRKTNSAAIAAEVRGFNLRTSESGFKNYPFELRDYLAIAALVACVVLAVIF